MRKSQFHLSRSSLKPSRKISTSLKNSTFPPLCENCLTITETITSNNKLNLNPSRKIPIHREKISTPHPQKKIATLPANFSIPLESFPTLLKFLNLSEKISTPHEKISSPPEKNSISPEKSQPPRKFLNPTPENFSTPLKISEPHSKTSQTPKIC